ncbi:hypothetical protein FACS1894198_1340 [Clostridia bacterium]|nr:hypothetical protein FACS1894198_1340 [Clostridia bacterium]
MKTKKMASFLLCTAVVASAISLSPIVAAGRRDDVTINEEFHKSEERERQRVEAEQEIATRRKLLCCAEREDSRQNEYKSAQCARELRELAEALKACVARGRTLLNERQAAIRN